MALLWAKIALFWAWRRFTATREENEALREAVRGGDLDAVNRLLSYGADPASVDDTGMSALHIAAGSLDDGSAIIAALIEGGAAVDAPDKLHRAPVHWAAYFNRPRSIRALAQAHARLDTADNTSNTPIMAAVKSGHEAAVLALKSVGSPPPPPECPATPNIRRLLDDWRLANGGIATERPTVGAMTTPDALSRLTAAEQRPAATERHIAGLYRHCALTPVPAAHRIAMFAMTKPELLRNNDVMVRTAVDKTLRLLEVVLKEGTKFHELGNGSQGVVYQCPRAALEVDPMLECDEAFGSQGSPMSRFSSLIPRRSTSASSTTPKGDIVVKKFRDPHNIRALREALVLSLVRHPNILSLEGLLLHHPTSDKDWLGVSGLVLPYIAGGTLQQAIERRQLRCLSQQLAAFADVVSAVAYLHAQRPRYILHCDIKPENLLRGPDGRVLLADFGVWHEGATGDATSTRDGTGAPVGGTKRYMAPETLGWVRPDHSQPAPLGRRSDIFSCGMVLWQLLTGALQPWPDVSEGRILQEHIDRLKLNPVPPMQPFSVVPSMPPVPVPLRPVLEAMWEMDPERRPFAPQLLEKLAAATREVASTAPLDRAERQRLVALAAQMAAEAVLYGSDTTDEVPATAPSSSATTTTTSSATSTR